MIKKKRSRWKPSKEEMSILYNLCYIKDTDTVLTIEEDRVLTRLYQDLKQEFFNGRSFENMFNEENN